MYSVRKFASVLTGVLLCSLLLTGCSGDQEKKEVKTTPTIQEQQSTDTSQALKSTMDKATKVAEQVEAKVEQTAKEVAEQADQTLDKITEESKQITKEAGLVPAKIESKAKRQLEGC